MQATLVDLTARSIVEAIDSACIQVGSPAPAEFVLCGGGRRNPTLVGAIQAISSVPVRTSDTFGIDGDQLEAMAFAWLARERLAHRPGSAASATGARGARVLGALYPAPRDLMGGADPKDTREASTEA